MKNRVDGGRASRGRAGRIIAGAVVGLPVAAGVVLAAAYAASALPPMPEPLENPITEQKRVLGKILFWDEQLSANNMMACGTCHIPSAGGYDPRTPGRNPGKDGIFNNADDALGSFGVIRSNAAGEYVRSPLFGLSTQATGRAANSPVNAGYAGRLFWDGRAKSTFVDPETGDPAIEEGGALESQAVGPPMSDVEMGHEAINWSVLTTKLPGATPLNFATSLPPDVQAALADNPDYPELFRRAFGDTAITAKRIAFAIGSYERTLVSDQTPFDAWLQGNNNALTPDQVDGLDLLASNNCTFCHNAGNEFFTDFSFRNVGLRPPSEDSGFAAITNDPNDRGKFKVPSLRNVALKRNFMHNGQFTTLREVMDWYNKAPASPPQFTDNQDPAMFGISFSGSERDKMIDFMVNGLTDQRVANQTFPFDRPTLASERVDQHAVQVAAGRAGSGGFVPAIIAESPAMIGNMEFRVGLHNAAGGSVVSLALSTNPPVGGEVQASQLYGPFTAYGSGDGQGLVTMLWPLTPGTLTPGQDYFIQWRIADAGAPGGVALSPAMRLTVFCGRGGCPAGCDADLNVDGNMDQGDVDYLINVIAGGENSTNIDPDFNRDGNMDQGDIDLLVSVIAGFPCPF